MFIYESLTFHAVETLKIFLKKSALTSEDTF